MTDDLRFMRLALEQAALAADRGEVPVGAVVVRHNEVVAVGSNAPIGLHDPSAHAEVVALRAAGQAIGNYRLTDCSLYVTLEPCLMCTGAIFQARIAEVVFGASDPKTGVAGSVLNLYQNHQLNHQTQVRGGVMAEECGQSLQEFFALRRASQRGGTGS
ncbi:MAG: tRNA adenosine(34) deaminase TadA [Pseudomonadota bacterium]|jgi:tRNA(adenine34) deaminase